MFVPIHHIHRARGNKNQEVKLRAILVAVIGALFTGIVSNAARPGVASGGKAVALGLALGLGCAALGLVVARAIGKQGRI